MIIKSITPFGIAAPLTAPIKMAKSQHTTARSMVVKIEDTDGYTGWGEASEAPMMNGETVPGMVAAVLHLIPLLEGLEVPFPQMFADLLRPMIVRNQGAKAALDIAIYDLIGKRERLPIYELMGGKKRNYIPAVWMLADNNKAEDVLKAKVKAQEGFNSFKIKVGLNNLTKGLERCYAVREATGKLSRISADANMALSLSDAIEFVKASNDFGLDFIEQPIESSDLDGMASITSSAGTTGVCADEGIHDLSDISAHYHAKAATGVGLKAIKLGGLTQLMEAAECADNFNLHINIAGKIAETAIASAAIIHIATAAPQVNWDISITCQYVKKDVALNPPVVIDGSLSVNDAPGLGLEIDEEAIAKMII